MSTPKVSGRQFAVLSALVVVAGFAGGMASNALLAPRSAGAQLPVETHVMVPEQGIAFRNNAGKVVARIASDANGGRFDLYDSEERPGVTLGTRTGGGGAIALYSGGTGRSLNGVWVLDPTDPWSGQRARGANDPFAAGRVPANASPQIAVAVPGR